MEQIILIGGFILNGIIVWIAVAQFKTTTKNSLDEKFSKKADKSQVDKIESDFNHKLEEFSGFNSGSHAEIKSEITLSEARVDKRLRELREDYVRGIESQGEFMSKIWTLLIEINKKI